MCAVEIVSDRTSNAVDSKRRDEVVANCVKREKLWVLGAGRNAVRFLPPLNITAEQIDLALERFAKAVKRVR